MRPLLKAANRFDSIWTTMLVLPAFFVMLNAGIAMQQGLATPAEFKQTAVNVVDKFTAQYIPYVETTSSGITKGVGKLSKIAGGCLSGSGPIYLNPAMARRNSCALGNKFASRTPIKPYRFH